MKGLKITPDGTVEEFQFGSSQQTDLHYYQRLVEGYIEAVPTKIPGVTMYCNEEGKLQGKTPNLVATVIADADVIVGTVILVGAPNASGDDTSLPDGFDVREAVNSLMGEEYYKEESE